MYLAFVIQEHSSLQLSHPVSWYKTNARIKAALVMLCVCLVSTACTSVSYSDATGSLDGRGAAVLWHPGLSVERVDQTAVTSPGLGGSDRLRIAPGLRRIYAVRSDYQPYVGTVAIRIHGQGNFQPEKIYYAHQNLVRGRLEIIELPDDFTLPQSRAFVLDPAYDEAVRQAEKIYRASIIPSLSSPANEIK